MYIYNSLPGGSSPVCEAANLGEGCHYCNWCCSGAIQKSSILRTIDPCLLEHLDILCISWIIVILVNIYDLTIRSYFQLNATLCLDIAAPMQVPSSMPPLPLCWHVHISVSHHRTILGTHLINFWEPKVNNRNGNCYTWWNKYFKY